MVKKDGMNKRKYSLVLYLLFGHVCWVFINLSLCYLISSEFQSEVISSDWNSILKLVFWSKILTFELLMMSLVLYIMFVSLYCVLFPFRAVKVRLMNLGYGEFDQKLRFYYTGGLFQQIPSYDIARHDKDFKNEDIFSLNLIADKYTRTQHKIHSGYLFDNPRWYCLAIYVFTPFFIDFMMGMGIYYFVGFDSHLLNDVFVYSQLFLIVYFLVIPIFLVKRKLRKKGYRAFSGQDCLDYFYLAAFFLPVPNYNDSVTLPGFEDGNIHSLMKLQLHIYKNRLEKK